MQPPTSLHSLLLPLIRFAQENRLPTYSHRSAQVGTDDSLTNRFNCEENNRLEAHGLGPRVLEPRFGLIG